MLCKNTLLRKLRNRQFFLHIDYQQVTLSYYVHLAGLGIKCLAHNFYSRSLLFYSDSCFHTVHNRHITVISSKQTSGKLEVSVSCVIRSCLTMAKAPSNYALAKPPNAPYSFITSNSSSNSKRLTTSRAKSCLSKS